MLYIPPNHFHFVEALDVSISANVWSYSNEVAMMKEIMTHTQYMFANLTHTHIDTDTDTDTHTHTHTHTNNVFQSKAFKSFASAYVITRTVTNLFRGELHFSDDPGMCVCVCVCVCMRVCVCEKKMSQIH